LRPTGFFNAALLSLLLWFALLALAAVIVYALYDFAR
jgi:hypothetical protein